MRPIECYHCCWQLLDSVNIFSCFWTNVKKGKKNFFFAFSADLRPFKPRQLTVWAISRSDYSKSVSNSDVWLRKSVKSKGNWHEIIGKCMRAWAGKHWVTSQWRHSHAATGCNTIEIGTSGLFCLYVYGVSSGMGAQPEQRVTGSILRRTPSASVWLSSRQTRGP